jgi:hypothetical protein
MGHTPPVRTAIGDIAADPHERLLAFVREREAIRLRRESGVGVGYLNENLVWTYDPILVAYRFCNVRREDDRVTRWISQQWRSPCGGDPDLWFAMMVARFVNWPDTLEHLGYPVPWKPAHFLQVMANRKRRRLKCYGGAYMIRADSGRPGRGTAEYQEAEMFTPLWGRRETLRPRPGDTLCSYHMTLGQLFGLGSFMAGQVVADLKYVEPLRSAPDWQTFACSGPGSQRGLNRVLGRPVNAPWTEEDWRLEADRLRGWLAGRFQIDGEPLHGQNVQNCLCEFFKYEKVRLGEGRPRARFTHTAPNVR